MKKMSRILMAVAIAFAGIACTTDVTEDLGVNPAGQTTLTLSLEESRTQLGEAVEGLYPVTWSENDAISVNGVASTSISIAESKATATFTFDGVLSYPYAIAYPAAAEGKVLFAAEQSHTEGTFANGAATMYGYAGAAGALTLNHLTGVLKFGVTGSKTLSYLQISTVDRAPIAGEFALDFTTGEVTATSASKDVIGYSFGDGLALSATAQYIHATVPAGVYDELYVTLYDTEGGVMYATVKADSTKPLDAGDVRYFSTPLAYAPNAEAFVIRDVKTLKEFAEAAPTLEKDVLFVADVDMTGEAWTPIEGYTKTINGNGYAIKGLSAPLFGGTSATIKGLHLTDIDQEWTTLAHGGTFACDLLEGGKLLHCSASGKVVINNTTYNTAVTSTYTDISFGGLVGFSTSGVLDNCTNDVDMELKAIRDASASAAYGMSWGGVVGAVTLGTEQGSLTNLVNKGDMCYANSRSADDVPVCTNYLYWGGIVGYNLKSNSLSAFSDLTNCGKLYTNESGYRLSSFRMGGIFGNVDTITQSDCSNWCNHGNIEITGKGTGNPCISGIGRTVVVGGALSNVVNHGDITLNIGYNNVYGSGIILGLTSATISNIVNYGDITVNKYGENSITGSLLIGGWSNSVSAEVVGANGVFCGNKGNITINTDVATTTTIGGIASNINKATSYINNDGNITITGTLTGAASIAGIGVNVVGESNNLVNNGAITLDGTYKAATIVGGIGTTISGKMDNATNNGALAFNGDATSTVYIGGIGSSITGVLTDVTNNGKLSTSKSSHGGTLRVGGIIAVEYKTTAETNTLTRANNNGDIDIDGGVKSSIGVGGLWAVNQAMATTFVNCHNKAYISIVSSEINNSSNNIAGLVGYTSKALTFDGCSNSGKVVDGVEKGIYVDQIVNHGYFDVAGGVGYVYRSKITILNGFTNSADVHVKVDKRIKSSYPVGGVLAIYNYSTTTNYEGWTGKIVNTGDITFEGEVLETEQLGVGGIVGISGANACSAELINTGKIAVIQGKNGMPATYGFGGIFGIANSTIENAKSFCDLQDLDICGHIGLITGSARSATVVAKNCQVGGSVIDLVSNEDADGNVVETLAPTPLNEENWFNYIYGTSVTWANDSDYDGCSFLSVAPTI